MDLDLTSFDFQSLFHRSSQKLVQSSAMHALVGGYMFDESISLALFKIFRNLEDFFAKVGNFSVRKFNLLAKLLLIPIVV